MGLRTGRWGAFGRLGRGRGPHRAHRGGSLSQAWRPRGSGRNEGASTCHWRWPTGGSGPWRSTSATKTDWPMLHKLLESADVFLTNMRPRALARRRPRCRRGDASLSPIGLRRGHGYGVRGPDADQAGYDATAFWARGGMAHILSPPEREYPIGQRGALGDRNGAMALAFGVAAALLKRSRTGTGSVVDVSLLSTAMWTLSSDLLAALGGDEPKASSGRGPLVNPLVGVYRTKDGRHISLVFLQPDRYWPDFCRIIGRPELLEDARFADMAARRDNAAACINELDREFVTRHIRRVEGHPQPHSTHRGPRPVRDRAARRPTGGGQRIHR